MNISWSIDPARRIVHLVYRGDPDFGVWSAAMEEILDHPDHRPGMGFVVDLTGAGFPDNAHLRRVAGFVRANRERMGGFRWANVTADPVHYGMTRMAQVIVEGLPGELEIFEEVEEAVEWAARGPDPVGG